MSASDFRVSIERLVCTAALAWSLGAPRSHAQTTNGWLQTTYGPWNYHTPTNWVNGVVNGTWDPSLTLGAHQMVTLGADTTLTYPLHFGYVGGVDLRLQGTGADRTLTLGGDIMHATASGRTVSLGNTGSGNGLMVNLGGVPRTMTVLSGRILKPYNAILNGSIILSGGGTLQMITDGATGTGVDFEVGQSSTLYHDSTASGSAGATRARDVTLRSAILKVGGNSGANSTDAIAGDLIIDADPRGGICKINLVPHSSRNTQLTARQLVRRNNAVVAMYDTRLGGIPGPNTANFVLTTPPSLIGGGGAAGTTTISILPWGLAGMSESISYAERDDTLLTYDASTGFRPLSFASEYLIASNVVAGSVSAQNVLVPHTNTWQVTADTTINALVLGGGLVNVATKVTGTGVLTVSSGMVLLGYGQSSTPSIQPPLNFGSQQGVFKYASGKNSDVSSSISGSGGLVLYQSSTTTGGAGIKLTGASTYTGDTFIFGQADISNPTFLPGGTRTGDLYLNGVLNLGNYSSTDYVINGLNGSGTLNGIQVDLFVGSNDASGDFSGRYLQAKYTSNLTKIGTGTQVLSGDNTYNGTTRVKGGSLLANGNHTGGGAYTVESQATLGGSGTIDRAGTAITVEAGGSIAPGDANGAGTMTVLQGGVAFADGSLLRIRAGPVSVAFMDVAGAVTGNGTVFVQVEGSGIGPWKIMEAASIAPTFISATPGALVYKAANDTELWVGRVSPGTVILLR